MVVVVTKTLLEAIVDQFKKNVPPHNNNSDY